MQKFLRLPEVMRATGLGRSSIYAHIADGRFPRPVPISGRTVGWLEAEIAEWQSARIAIRDGVRREAA